MPRVFAIAFTALFVAFASPALAQVTRLEIQSREPASNGQTFGVAGPYEIVRGRVHGEVDPKDPKNAIIQDVALAPRNARGRIEYVATFALARPVDMSKASGVLVYSVVNRGNGTVAPEPEGHISLVSGWQGDVVPTADNQTITVPIAKNADGSTITGPVIGRFTNLQSGTNTVEVVDRERLDRMGAAGECRPIQATGFFQRSSHEKLARSTDIEGSRNRPGREWSVWHSRPQGNG
jgi:hypothetical protein